MLSLGIHFCAIKAEEHAAFVNLISLPDLFISEVATTMLAFFNRFLFLYLISAVHTNVHSNRYSEGKGTHRSIVNQYLGWVPVWLLLSDILP